VIQGIEVYLLDEVHLQHFQDVVGTDRKVELLDPYPTAHHQQRTAIDSENVPSWPPRMAGREKKKSPGLAPGAFWFVP